jgi:hypothetical protein
VSLRCRSIRNERGAQFDTRFEVQSIGAGSVGKRRVASAFYGNREIQECRGARPSELSLDGIVDNLLDVRSTATAAKTRAGRPRNIARRIGAVFHKTSNLSVGDSAAMANEHRISLFGS